VDGGEYHWKEFFDGKVYIVHIALRCTCGGGFEMDGWMNEWANE